MIGRKETKGRSMQSMGDEGVEKLRERGIGETELRILREWLCDGSDEVEERKNIGSSTEGGKNQLD